MEKKVEVWYENPPGSGPPQGLYSHVGFMRGGSLAFIAGQLAVGSQGEVIGKSDFKAQFRQVFSNLRDVLSGMGADYPQIVKFTTYLVHSQDIAHFMTERQALFPSLFGKEPYPPNTLLVVDRLVKEDFLIEVEAVAAIER
jgi:enamine deaminase RidA (YjgF/YER057c/UK114 family)